MPIYSLEIDGGINTEMGPSAGTRVKRTDGQSTVLSVPYLINATNAVYAADGWPRKMPGASKVNASATGATDSVTGIFDYWRSTTSGDPVQRKVIVAGTAIYSEAGAGTLTSIKTGLEADKMPWFEVFNDDVIIATTSTTDVPMTWDQTTFANLGGTPPNFAFHVSHKNYMFAAGVNANKSRLYYSATNDAEDWTGGSAGSIDVAPDDGDVITGLHSRHNGELLIFKGPNRLSFFRLTGSSESDWTLTPGNTGIGAVNQQSIVSGPGSDVWFWDDNGIHSLVATDTFGDYKETFLSKDIATYFVERLSHNRFAQVWGANFVGKGCALWTCSRSGSSTHNLIIGLDYRFSPPRFFFWDAYNVASLGMVRDTSRLTIPWAGTYTGFVLRTNREARNVAGTAYTYKMTMPFLGYGDPFFDKKTTRQVVGFQPKGATTFTLGITRDTHTQQTASLTQGGGPTLGPSSDQFTLDEDALGGGLYNHAFADLNGSFKQLQIELSQGTVDVDCEPHGVSVIAEDEGLSYRVPEG